MNKRALSILLLILLSALIASIIFLSLVPPVGKDELAHHLAVPKLYLKHGGMYEIPFMPFSYYPMNLDLLYLIPLYLGNDIVPKFIHFIFALLTAWLLFRYIKRRINALYALFGVLFFLSIPVVLKLSISAYVDLGLMFFSTASLLLLFKWIESKRNTRYLVFSAMMCGLGLGTKYNGLLTFLLLTLFVPVFYARSRAVGRPVFFKSAVQGLLFFFVALLFFSPWMIRNYRWTGNPIFPLYDSWFQSAAARSGQNAGVAARKGGLGVFAIRRVIYGENTWQIALVPLRAFFQGKDGSPQYFDGQLSPFLLLLPALNLLGIRRDRENLRREKKTMAAFSILFVTFAFFTSDFRIRYVSPVIPPLVILSALGLNQGVEWLRRWTGPKPGVLAASVCFLLSAAPLFFNAIYLYDQFREVEPWSYIQGSVTKDEYIEKRRPEYPGIQYINKVLSQDAHLMLIYLGGRVYYLERDYVFGEGIFGQYLRESETSRDLWVRLQKAKISHLYIYDPLFYRWMEFNFDGERKAVLRDFFVNYTSVVFSKNEFTLYALLTQ